MTSNFRRFIPNEGDEIVSGWGSRFETIIDSWEGGTRTTTRPDLIPSNTSPLVYNGSWERIGDGTAIVEKRPGFTMINQGAALGSTVQGQYFYDRRDPATGNYTTHHILLLADGTMKTINDTSGAITSHTGGFSAAITGKYVSGITAANLAFIAGETATTAGGVAGNGLKFDGTSWTVMGITAPAAPTVTGTSAGSMTGTYDVAVSYHNSATGHQSSRSPETSITVTSKSLNVSWAASADSQVTHVNVHLRAQALSTGYYQATSVAVGSTSVTLDVTDAQYNALTTISPDEDENDPVPSGTKFLTWHKSRVFAATSSYVYYSKIEFPEAFDPERFEPVNTDDGQAIMGMIQAFDHLIIFKERSFYALIGDGPNDWRVQQISSKIGLAASGSIILVEGLLYWWANDGPVVWDGVNDPKRLGKSLISETIRPTAINATELDRICGIEDRQNERIMWAVPESGSTENSIIIPFKYRLGQFEGVWTGLHPASLARGKFTDGFEWCYVGSYGGRVYRFGDRDFDGLPSGAAYTGTFTPLTSTITTISGTGFDTTTGYADLMVVVVDDATGEIHDKVGITSNTATVLTLEESLNGLSTTTLYRFYISGIDFQFDTKWQDDGNSLYKKRYEFLFVQTQVNNDSNLYVGLSFNFDDIAEIERSLALTSYGASASTIATWDVSKWDVETWVPVLPEDKRLRIARAAKTWRMRIQHTEPRVDFGLFKVGIRGEYLTVKQ